MITRSSRADYASEKIRILHVDDEPDFADMVATFLEREDDRFSIDTATSASEGLDRLNDDEFDCVLSDYDMPGQNGIEFLEEVRDEYPDLPFILFTGKGSEEVASDAISAGVTDYLQKERGSDQYPILANRITNTVSARRATTEAERTKRRLEQIVKTVPACIVQLNYDGEFIFANERAVEVLGLERSDVTDRAYNDPKWEIRDLNGNPIPDEELPFRQVRDSGEPVYGYQHTITWPDGTRVVLMMNGAPLFDEDGNVENVVFALSDITDYRERTRELQRSKARLEALFKNSPDMIDVHDGDGTIIDVNARLCEETGYDEDELVGMKVWEIDQEIDPDDAHALWAEMGAGKRRELEGVYQRRDGSTFPAKIHIRQLDSDEGDRFVVISRNISEQKEHLETIRDFHHQAQELIRADTTEAIAQTAVGIAQHTLGLRLSGVHLVTDDRDVLEPVAVTDAVREHFDDVPRYDRTDPSRSADVFNWEVFKQGEPVVIDDTRIVEEIDNAETPSRSGIIHPLGDHGIFITSSAEPNAFDNPDRYLVELLATILTAVLDRTDRETELRKQKQLLRAERDRLDEFASVVSHDLRNPLRVAEGQLELVGEECDSEHLDSVANAHERMNALIEDLLTLAREGNRVSETEAVDLAELSVHCWRNVETAEATIRTSIDRTIQADRSRLAQLLENLIRNAVEHGSDDATVTVGELDDGFHVEDDGPGIPEGERDDVFDAGYSSAEDGTGFGLSIVKQIADAHGWDIRVTEGTDGGARFEITGVEFAG